MNEVKKRETIGKQLAAIRFQKGLTKYRVAKDGGISINQVNIVERGDTNYTVNILLGYLTGCGLDIHFGR